MRLEEILAPVSSDLAAVESRLHEWASDDLSVASEAVAHVVRAGGKRLRPACLLLAAGLGEGGRRDKVVELATAVEIIHTASLVHDDIVDGAPLRRGRPTLQARWGQGVALLVGDLLYSRIFRDLVGDKGNEEALRSVADTVHRMVQGELAETVRRDDLTLSETEYLEIVGNKSSALFGCATYLGAWVGGLPEGDTLRLRRCGERLGTAFQIVDDVLDICEEETDLGKPAGADLREGKVTLPVIHALARDGGRAYRVIAGLFCEKKRDELCAEMRRGGSLAYAVERAEEAAGEAAACLEGLPGRICLRGLVGMGEYVVSRGRDALARFCARAGGSAVVGGRVPAAALGTR